MLGRFKKSILGLGIMGAFHISSADIPLLQEFPQLKNSLPYVQLGQWPTPVGKLHNLGNYLNLNLYIKREDLCAQKFGGNKVRKPIFAC